MPVRLSRIFDQKQTKPEDRYTELSDCGYSGSALVDAENYKIFPRSSYVADEEGLARVMECPNGIGSQGQFHALAFQECMKRGLSTQRIMMTTEASIHEFGQKKTQIYNNKPTTKRARTYLGFIVGLAGHVRNITNAQGVRIFGVFSTPENHVAHADIFVVTEVDEGDKLAVQHRFHQIFKIDAIVRPVA